jgi:hypothetical protein
MPGRGRVVERPYTGAELAAFREGLADLGLTYDQLTACLGGACYDVFLSDVAYWRCVPARVWKYTIGGYQVMCTRMARSRIDNAETSWDCRARRRLGGCSACWSVTGLCSARVRVVAPST